MRVLKQSTSATVLLGPFLDKTDGVTEETGLAATGTEISKAGGAFGAGPTLGTHDSDGWYPISLTTTHTNTLGDLTIKVHDNATHLPVWAHFTVLPANAYDGMVSGSGVGMRSDVQGWLGSAPAAVTNAGVPEVDITHIAGAAVSTTTAQLGVNIVQISTDATAADNAEAFFDGTGYAGTGNTIPTVTAVTTVNGLAANVITAASMAADASAEIADAVWDEDATGHQTGGTFGQAIGDPGADTNTIYGATVTAATGATVGADTTTLLTRMGTPSDLGGGATLAGNLSDIESQTDDIGVAGAGLTAINLPDQTMNITGDITGNLSGSVGSVTGLTASDVSAIKVQTDKLTFTVANQVDSNTKSVAGTTVTGSGTEGDPWGP